MTSIIHRVFSVGLGLVHNLTQQLSRLFHCRLGSQPVSLRSNSLAGFTTPFALWGRITSRSEDTPENHDDGLHRVGFETYLFPIHAVAVLAKGKYPLLQKRQVTLCLSENQYQGIKVYLSPKLKPFMRIEVHGRWDGRQAGLQTALSRNIFYVKERSMIALTSFF